MTMNTEASPVEQSGLGAHEEAAVQRLKASWGVVLLLGIMQAIAGILILSIEWTPARLASFIGVVFILRGITDVVSSGSMPSAGLAIFTGLAGMGVGILALAWPGPTLFVIATFTGVWLLVWGFGALIGSIAATEDPLWWLTLIAGMVAIPLGVWALAHPGATLAVMIAVVGIWTIAAAVTSIVIACQLRSLPDRVESRPRTQPV